MEHWVASSKLTEHRVAPSNLFGGVLNGKTHVLCEFICFVCFTRTNGPDYLRDRAEDIPALAEYFLKEAAAGIGSKVAGITDAAQMAILNYECPGNIRQL